MTRKKAHLEAKRINRTWGLEAMPFPVPGGGYAVLLLASETNPQMLIHEPGWTPPATLYVP